MSATLPILNAFKDRLNEQFPDWAIELMPDEPEGYYLSHPNGAILISYAGSKFGAVRPTDAVIQTRTVHIVLTVISRHLHNDFGAVELLDSLRLAIVGFRPPNSQGCYLVDEQFDDHTNGIWIYQLAAACETVQVEQQAVKNSPKFANLIPRQDGQPLSPQLKPK